MVTLASRVRPREVMPRFYRKVITGKLASENTSVEKIDRMLLSSEVAGNLP